MSGRDLNFVRQEFCQAGILSGRDFVRKRALPGSGLCQEAGSARKRALPGRRVSFGVVCVVYFLFLGAGFRGCEGGRGASQLWWLLTESWILNIGLVLSVKLSINGEFTVCTVVLTLSNF